MFKVIKEYLIYYSLWVAFFLMARLIFLLYYFQDTQSIGFQSFMKTFFYGVRLDLSAAGYFSVLPFLLLTINILFKRKNYWLKVVQILTATLIILSSVLISIDLGLYQNWGFRLDDTFLKYLKSPKEMMASSSTSPVFLFVFIAAMLSFLSIYVFNRLFFTQLKFSHPFSISLKKAIPQFLLGLILTFSLIIPIRGGFQLAPVNQSAVYFSNQPFANHAAVNVLWNFFVSVFEKTTDRKNPYSYFSKNEAAGLVQELFKDSSTTNYLIKKNIKNPNVIIITWESLTAKAIEKLGGVGGVTPQLNALCSEGVLFSNMYAAGDRTHLGLMAILAGYPTLSEENVFEVPRKSAQLPCLSRDFKVKGYQTGFYYGGEAEFANMKSYLLNGQFNKLITISDFDKKDLSSKWGAFDHVVLNRAMTDLTTIQQPFFINILTLSSHEPFEIPNDSNHWGIPNFQKSTDENELFKNVMYYTDQAVGAFINEAKKQVWWDNTLIVIIADHGSHRLEPHDNEFKNFHIPMIWCGGALAVKDTIFAPIGSQTDIPATVLAQLDVPFKDYKWSKNILSTQYQPFAYFNFHGGFGFVQNKGQYVWDTEGSFIRRQNGVVDSSAIRQGKAYLQATNEDFFGK